MYSVSIYTRPHFEETPEGIITKYAVTVTDCYGEDLINTGFMPGNEVKPIFRAINKHYHKILSRRS
jgi:hypothetical protein